LIKDVERHRNMSKIICACTGLKAYALMMMMVFYNKGPKEIHPPEERGERRMEEIALVGDL
jgi:hypothetical protein